ncbi:MAG: acyl carrier protein [Alphaproteobacteria bacterium]|nr:acyl carrier protein [Alphaproteobacteria bacterium]
MDPERLKDRFFAVLSSILEIDARSLPLDASPDTVESWDSLKNMYIIQNLEEAFGIVFTDVEIFELASLSDLLGAVGRKMGGHHFSDSAVAP